MKFILFILGSSFVVALFYFLYQHQMGAIPFLLGAFILFYFSYRLSSRVQKNQAGKGSKETDAEDSPALTMDVTKK